MRFYTDPKFALTPNLLNVLQGGKFGHGFVSAGLGSAVGGSLGNSIGGAIGSKVAGRIISGAVVGGTISEATGGKFANGAATGAFASLANEAAISYANAHKAPQLNLPEFSVTPGSPKMGADLTTGEVELVALDLSAPYEGETFNKVAPVSTLAAGELNIDWSAVGSTNVFDVPYLDTGWLPTEQDALYSVGVQGALRFQQQALAAAVAPIIASNPVTAFGAAENVAVGAAIDSYKGREITLQSVNRNAVSGAFTGKLGGFYARLTGFHASNGIIFRINTYPSSIAIGKAVSQ